MSNYQHTEWLSLIEISGPFLAVPVLKETFPQGLDQLGADNRKRIRQAYDEWREAKETKDPQFPAIHVAWIEEVLCRGLELDADGAGDVLKRDKTVPDALKISFPEHGVSLVPDYAVVNGQQGDKPLLLIQTYPEGTRLDAPIKGDGWSSSPAERMVQLCRAVGCRMGLITDGERWMLVDAPVGATTTFASWYARLWLQEPVTLQAFVALLGIRRFFLDEAEQLPALMDRSLQHQDEVTDALGEQVRRAVEVLVQALDRADLDRNRDLLHDVAPAELYEAGLTVMMRLVFLLCAEERDLLLLGNQSYEANYAVSTLRAQLRKDADEILERRWDAWSRLLAVFRAVYGGIEYENLRLPALGGSLFDPDRFPFLEGRSKDLNWRYDPAKPLPIDNRTVLMLLESIQMFQGRTLSYRALDVEQIGHVYEGLLERTVKRAMEETLELSATKKAEKPWVTLGELESARLDGTESLTELLKERTVSSESRIRNDLKKDVSAEQADLLLTACNADQSLRDRIKPYFHLLRTDPWGYPLVYPKGAFMVTTGSDRRETGTHYTPKSLTEAIVKETLEPIVYAGPVEGKDRKDWKLKSPAALLDLKICDMAMGSGAFLVQVCRWLSERLVESWRQAESNGKIITTNGSVLDSYKDSEPLPTGNEERIIIARRLVAERCLYGVDFNPLAVELAKLSIWLVTFAKGRPFGFLDHNLRCGDSLLGIQNLDQLNQLTISSEHNDPLKLFAHKISHAVLESIKLREKIRNRIINDIHDVKIMSDINSEVRQNLESPELIADALIAEVLNSAENADSVKLSIIAAAIMNGDKEKIERISYDIRQSLNSDLPPGKSKRRPFHWPLEFPEVFGRDNSGFDAIIGNPPFMKGRNLRGIFGEKYREWLVINIAAKQRGACDLVGYFFLRAGGLINKGGIFNFICVKTLSEGESRKVCFEPLQNSGMRIIYAATGIQWPGSASVTVSVVGFYNGKWAGKYNLNGNLVKNISPTLSDDEEWIPKQLESITKDIYQGVIVLGEGFILPEAEFEKFSKNENYKKCVFPYFNSQKLYSSYDLLPSQGIISFWDWDIDEIKKMPELVSIIEEKVKPVRQEKKSDGSFKQRNPLPQKWWQFADKRPALFHDIGMGKYFKKHPDGWSDNKVLKRVIVRGMTGKHHAFLFLPLDIIYDQTYVIIAREESHMIALLQSTPHHLWFLERGSTMGDSKYPRYNPKECYLTFVKPEMTASVLGKLEKFGEDYYEHLIKIMNERKIGTTEVFNLIHDESCTDLEIESIREVLVKIDNAVLEAYGWNDLSVIHGFYSSKNLPDSDNKRFMIDTVSCSEILLRLKELNKMAFYQESDIGKNVSKKSIKNVLQDGAPDLFKISGG